jgi:hypothetical protein
MKNYKIIYIYIFNRMASQPIFTKQISVGNGSGNKLFGLGRLAKNGLYGFCRT